MRAVDSEGGEHIIIATNEMSARSAILEALDEREILVLGPDDAEVNALNAARIIRLNPVEVAASRPICAGCQITMRANGVSTSSPLKDYSNVGWTPNSSC
jgi:hypothetical protein